MKVTMINAGFPVPPVHSGPIAQTIYETALTVQDPQMSVISPWSKDLENITVPSGIFYHVDVNAQKLALKNTLDNTQWNNLNASKSAWRLAYFNGVVHLLNTLDPDIIQVHNGPSMVPGLARQFPHKKIVTFLHNNLGVKKTAPAMYTTDHAVLVSHSMTERTLKLCAECRDKISVIHNSVDTNLWHPNLRDAPETAQVKKDFDLPPGQTVLFVGRLVPEKGILHLLEAVDRIRRHRPHIKLIAVGSSVHGNRWTKPFESEVKSRAAKMKNAVIFTGYVNRDQIPYLYAAADISVVPSVWAEPFGKVVAESMATGIPVVGSRRGGIPEIIEEGISGELINDPKDIAELAKKIEDLLGNEKKRQKMGRAARQRVEQYFSLQARTKALQNFYQRIQSPTPKPVPQGQAKLKVTMVNSQWLPVPPVNGGPVAETIYDTALAIDNPQMTAISPWSSNLEGITVPPDVFYHVNKTAEAHKAKKILGDQMPKELQDPRVAGQFYYLRGVSNLLKQINPNVIQVHNRPAFVPSLVRQFPDKHLVLFMHNQPNDSEILVKEALSAADDVVVVSHFMADYYTQRYPICASKITVIHNGVDTTKWHPKLKTSHQTRQIQKDHNLPSGQTILFVGRLVRQKGIEYLIDAMTQVRSKFPNAKLLVAGSPFFKGAQKSTFVKQLERKAAHLGNSIAFTGYVDHQTTPHLYAAADITVSPSIYTEAFSKVILESMATGTPVIGTRCGGTPEIIEDGTNGLLVDQKDAHGLAKQIENLLTHHKQRELFGQKARKCIATKFSLSTRWAHVRSFYNKLESRIKSP